MCLCDVPGMVPYIVSTCELGAGECRGEEDRQRGSDDLKNGELLTYDKHTYLGYLGLVSALLA